MNWLDYELLNSWLHFYPIKKKHHMNRLKTRVLNWLGWSQSKQKRTTLNKRWMKSGNGWRELVTNGWTACRIGVQDTESLKWTEIWGRWAAGNGGALWVYNYRKLSNKSYLRWTLAPSVCCKANGSKQTAVIQNPTSRWTKDFKVLHNQSVVFPAG